MKLLNIDWRKSAASTLRPYTSLHKLEYASCQSSDRDRIKLGTDNRLTRRALVPRRCVQMKIFEPAN